MIGIIFSNNLNTCPYIDKYIDTFERLGVEYEVILWNREQIEVNYPSNYKVYNMPSDIYGAKWKKIRGFYGFRKFIIHAIRTEKYEKLIFLTTFTALMCYGLTQHKYANKYIFDFRDLGFEYNRLYRKCVKRIIDKSYFTCMSSPGFATVFQLKNYIMAHNFRYKDLRDQINQIKEKSGQIVLLHIGITRGEAYNKRLVDIFGGDDRFVVYIVGSGNDTDTFMSYVEPYSNIIVQGRYDNEDKSELIAKADMLLYYYPSDFNCNRALANKYYDGLIYKKPLIGNINTYSGKRLQRKGLGISLDLSDDKVADKIYSYFKKLDQKFFLDSVKKELDRVMKEDEVYIKKMEEFALGSEKSIYQTID